MGEARRRRKAHQLKHGGPVPPPENQPMAVQLTILVAKAFADELDKEFEAMAKPTDRPVTRQDFLERLLYGGFRNYQQWKAQQQERGSLVQLAGPAEMAQVTALEEAKH